MNDHYGKGHEFAAYASLSQNRPRSSTRVLCPSWISHAVQGRLGRANCTGENGLSLTGFTCRLWRPS